MSKPYGTTINYDYREGKLHKRHRSWNGWARCGSAKLKRYYETPGDHTPDELCKKCFKSELAKRQRIIKSFLLPEELFQI